MCVLGRTALAGGFNGDEADYGEKQNYDSYYDTECQYIHFSAFLSFIMNFRSLSSFIFFSGVNVS